MEYMIFAAVCLALCVAYCVGLTLWVRKELDKLEKSTDRRVADAKDFAEVKVVGIWSRLSPYREDVEQLKTAVRNLEQGIVPDFEEAKKAAKAVNDFNTGISAIMEYDPMEARRKMREGRKGEIE